MSSLQPLITLLQQVESQRDQAQVQQQRAELKWNSAQQQAEQLLAYRADYIQRYGPQAGRPTTLELMRCYEGFMSRLQDAIRQQDQMVVQCEQAYRHASHVLTDYELKIASVQKLIERRQKEKLVQEEKRERKITDEQATRIALHNRHHGFGHTQI